MNRETLAKQFTGVGIELGVARGCFSKSIVRFGNPKAHFCVDRWSDHHDLKEYLHVVDTFRTYPQVTVLRSTFADALQLFPDNFFQYIYIDGYAHTGQDGGKTLVDWWKKLAPGGIFAGHDYHDDFPLNKRNVSIFAAEHGGKLSVTSERKYPSWWITKPGVYTPPVKNQFLSKDSSVVVVGNGPSVLGTKQGKVIDDFDEVIRINRYKTSGLEEFTGSKTTVWCTFGKEQIPQEKAIPEKVIYMQTSGCETHKPKMIARIPAHVYVGKRREIQSMLDEPEEVVKNVIPSTGFILIAYLLEVVGLPVVHITGFDHFQKDNTKLHHYWTKQKTGQPLEHRGWAEKELMEVYEKQGRLVYLNKH